MRSFAVFVKLLFEITVVVAWVAFAVGIALNDPPLNSILFTAGLLVVITTIVVAFTRRLRR